MALIREDRLGLFVKVGGYIARPQVSDRYRNQRPEAVPSCGAGENVKARHIATTGLAWVDGQVWFTHGCYFKEMSGEKPSVDCWDPA